MADRPWAVVFQTADGGTYEMYVPPAFAFTVSNGGILVITEKSEVVSILSARPLPGGEATNADLDQDSEQDTDPDVGERGPDDGGFMEDPVERDGRDEAAPSSEGGGVHGTPGISSEQCPYCFADNFDCDDSPCIDRLPVSAGDGCEDPDDGAGGAGR